MSKTHMIGNKYSLKDLSGKIINGCTIIKDTGERKRNSVIWEIKCVCGNVFHRLSKNITSKMSCGCLQKKQISERSKLQKGSNHPNFVNCENVEIGDIKILDYSHSKSNRSIWNIKCKCGKLYKHDPYEIITNKVKSCGNCQNRKNGIQTSYMALELHKIIGRGIHNYKTEGGLCLDIAIVENGQKIGIEYDEWYWHGGRQQEDAIRIQKLLECGWKIIQIKASQNLPTIEQINEALNALNNVNHYIIQLPNWGTRKYFKQGEIDVN